MFNGPPVFDNSPATAGAQAMGKVRLYGFGRDRLYILIHYRNLALGLLRLAADEEHHLVKSVEDLSFRNVTKRLARILLDQIDESDYSNSGRKGITQGEIAASSSALPLIEEGKCDGCGLLH